MRKDEEEGEGGKKEEERERGECFLSLRPSHDAIPPARNLVGETVRLLVLVVFPLSFQIGRRWHAPVVDDSRC